MITPKDLDARFRLIKHNTGAPYAAQAVVEIALPEYQGGKAPSQAHHEGSGAGDEVEGGLSVKAFLIFTALFVIAGAIGVAILVTHPV
jgi:hypothetical protein